MNIKVAAFKVSEKSSNTPVVDGQAGFGKTKQKFRNEPRHVISNNVAF